MKSFCIKTNHEQILHYLLNEFQNFSLSDTYFLTSEFKIYKNVIVHYKGENLSQFYHKFTNILVNCILEFYEKRIIKSLLSLNYFYFDVFEQEQILEYTLTLLEQPEEDFFMRKEKLYVALFDYLQNNKCMILDGFVSFRLKNYMDILDQAIDSSVNHFLIEREYSEFIHLLKLYIASKDSECDCIHVIYRNGECILLDEQKNVIPVSDYVFNAKYLSDITFSSNDYALNTLLTLLPKKIDIHLIDPEDEFIHTLQLIFEGRVRICTDCNLCRTYRLLTNQNITRTH